LFLDVCDHSDTRRLGNKTESLGTSASNKTELLGTLEAKNGVTFRLHDGVVVHLCRHLLAAFCLPPAAAA
jgi:hypothetical protein